MKLNFKVYKLLKTKSILQNNSLILITSKINNENHLILKKNYKTYLIRNKLFKTLIKRSILSNLSYSINNYTVLATVKNKINVGLLLKHRILIGILLNKKLYSSKQLKKIKTLNYKENIKNLRYLLKLNLTLNSLKLKKISK